MLLNAITLDCRRTSPSLIGASLGGVEAVNWNLVREGIRNVSTRRELPHNAVAAHANGARGDGPMRLALDMAIGLTIWLLVVASVQQLLGVSWFIF